MSDVSVVVPILNERESIEPLVTQIHAALSAGARSYEILLVDDGSTDGSWDELVRMAGRFAHLRLIRLRRNFGQTAAMSAGFHAARGDVVVTLDADLQNDPGDIPRLLAESDKGVDVVSGWRKHRHDPLITRRLPSMLANALISKITGVALHDYGCTLKAYRREVVERLHLYGEMHRFIPALASWVGASVVEVPVSHRARRFGASKYGLSRTFRVILDLMTVKFLLRYSTHPIQMFGKIGLFFGLPGLLMLGVLVAGNVAYWIAPGAVTEYLVQLSKRPFWVVMPFMLILFCMQFISMGLLAEIQIRTYHESQQKPIYVIREMRESPGAAPGQA